MSGKRVLIRYPSGNEAMVTGEFLGPGYLGEEEGTPWHRVTMESGWPAGMADDGKSVAILVTETSMIGTTRAQPGSAVMIDPRAVCEDEATGTRLFAPSLSTPGTCQWVIDWLHEHPEWPPEPEQRPDDQLLGKAIEQATRPDDEQGPVFSVMVKGEITPSMAIELRDSLHIVTTYYRDDVLERALWQFCDRERAGYLINGMQRFTPDTTPLIWSRQTWELAQSGREAFESTRADDDIWKLGGAQLWLWSGFEIGWESKDVPFMEFFELDVPCFTDQMLLVPTGSLNDGSPGLTIIILFFPTTDAVKDGVSPLPRLRAFPRLKPGDELHAVYAMVAAALSFLRLDFVVRASARPGWDVEKRYQRAKLLTPSVDVVQLRRIVRDQGTGTPSGREYSCQWPVRGHWRKQWYGRSHEHRIRWIMPYLKGDPSKPLKPPSDTVYTVVH